MKKQLTHPVNVVFVGISAILVLWVSLSFAREQPVRSLRNIRKINFTYSVVVDPVPRGQGPVNVFIPLALSDNTQKILDYKVTASIPGTEKRERIYGNKFWHGHLKKSDGKPITVSVDYTVERYLVSMEFTPELADAVFKREELEGEALFLKANTRVPVTGEIVQRVRKDLPKTEPKPLPRARAIYDYVIDTMEYKKVGTGWGNGDTYWACSERYGNCTDYHALFISLARAEGIPSRFEIGFPIPEDATEGMIKGYHCWVTLKLPDIGWMPIDASEADKHPEKRALFFGTHPTDRIKFTVGRDLQLGEGHTTKPLNYFIYPHVEIGGKHYKKVKTELRFAELVP